MCVDRARVESVQLEYKRRHRHPLARLSPSIALAIVCKLVIIIVIIVVVAIVAVFVVALYSVN